MTACGAPAEQEVADGVRQAMDLSADPCQDFYQYACGGWLESTELPADEVRWGRSFSEIAKRVRESLREILEESAAHSDPEMARLGNFYGACMDEAAVEQAGLAPLEPWFADIASIQGSGDFLEMTGKLHASAILALFQPLVLGDLKNPDTNINNFIQGGLGLPDRDYYFDESKQEELAAYKLHVAAMFELLGESAADAQAISTAVTDFETELASASRTATEMRDIERLYNKMDVSGLKELTPKLEWGRYFEAIGYPEMDLLNVGTPEFFEKVEQLTNATEPAVLQDYLRWQLVTNMAQTLPAALVEEDFNFFQKTLGGRQEMRERWRLCIGATDGAMGELLGKAFVEREFAGDSKQIAQEMIRGIEDAFAAGLPMLAWMDDVTRSRAMEKMEALGHKIGYPDQWRDYSSIEVREGDYFGNTLRANQFEFKREADKVGHPVDRAEWGMSPPTVNAYYNPLLNEMVFPAGVLQPPFFHRTFPPAMNFGGIGLAMGHELTHGYDDMGRRFNPQGKMTQWWEDEAIERFTERAQCVDDLYSTYEVQPDVKVNGKLTLGENIADLGGLKEAYLAYRQYEEEHGQSAPLLEELTNDQLFFVAFAQTWCSKTTPEEERKRVVIDPHSPARFRVEGPVSNSKDFAQAFGCEQGTPMNPADKCEVW
jgi:predicted metalloendopeptidase